MAEDQALRQALEVAQRQLLEAEDELRDVRERVRNLRAVVYGLKQIFEPGDVGRLADSVSVATGDATQRRTDSRADEGSISPSVRRAVQLLAEVGRPMRMPEITSEWIQRGWADPAWKTPKSAINMVYQRALKSGLVGRMPDRSWVLRANIVQADDASADQGQEARGGDGH
jgi:hypothetical protein